ncbi:MAG: GH3 auxin-responsive promoter family protein [Saprospiraceae bacterium]
MIRKVFNKAFGTYLRLRYPRIRRYMEHPHEVQKTLLMQLVRKAAPTEWGQQHNFASIRTEADFRRQVPVQDYEHLKPYIDTMMHGRPNVLWPGKVTFFSKSSGTTSDKSKYIPVSDDNLRTCHIRGTRDTMTLFYRHRPDARQFEKKTLLMGGSLHQFDADAGTLIGDVSAVMIHNMPAVARPFVTPDIHTSLLPDFEEKIDRMVRISGKEDVVMIGGVPTWTVVLFRKLLEYYGKSNILEIWPNLQGYVHGGVSFTPYRKQFQDFLPSENIRYQEIYNASEGYFAAQDDFQRNDMLLLLDNGVYFEFLPMEEWHSETPRAIPLEAVELDKQYALVISTNAGLWRYMIGDTVTFTSLKPYRIRITGRTKQFINVFGEEVVVENTDRALAIACQKTGAVAQEYTVAPVFLKKGKKGGHEWLIEFEQAPADIDAFASILDQELQNLNSDYEAKRYHNMALEQLRVHPLPPGTFAKWMKARGKFGGQNKVPRLSNERKYVESILQFKDEELRN